MGPDHQKGHVSWALHSGDTASPPGPASTSGSPDPQCSFQTDSDPVTPAHTSQGPPLQSAQAPVVVHTCTCPHVLQLQPLPSPSLSAPCCTLHGEEGSQPQRNGGIRSFIHETAEDTWCVGSPRSPSVHVLSCGDE